MKKRFVFIAMMLLISVFTLSACDMFSGFMGSGGEQQGSTNKGRGDQCPYFRLFHVVILLCWYFYHIVSE